MMNHGASHLDARRFFPDEPVSWVGPGRGPDEVCLGFESGKLQFRHDDFRPKSVPTAAIGSGEAINGAVFWADLHAVSTRNEIVFQSRVDGTWREAQVGRGAHGLTAGPEGELIAPLGADGLLCVRRMPNGAYAQHLVTREGHRPYFYRTVYLGRDETGSSLYASACRRDGFALITVEPDLSVEVAWASNRGSGDDSDVVGVCAAGLPDHPRSLILLTMDGALHLTRDARIGSFITGASASYEGTPYTIATSRGHLALLTSRGVHYARDLVATLARGLPAAGVPSGIFVRADAVDLVVIGAEVVVIHEDQVTLNRIDQVFGSAQAGHAEADPFAATSWSESSSWTGSRMSWRAGPTGALPDLSSLPVP